MFRKFRQKRAIAVFPKGAITFQMYARARSGLSKRHIVEAKAIIQKFGFSKLIVMHGNALLVNGKAIIITGPAGIGKSTISREVVRKKDGQLIDESHVLIGQKGGEWFVVETGAKEFNRKTSN